MEMVSFLLLLALGSPHTRKWINVMKKDIDLIKQHHRRSRSLFQPDSAVTAQRRRQVADLFGAPAGQAAQQGQLSRSYEAPKARPEQTPKAPHAPTPGFSPIFSKGSVEGTIRRKRAEYLSMGSVAAGAPALLVPGPAGSMVSALLAPAVVDLVSEARRRTGREGTRAGSESTPSGRRVPGGQF